MDQSHCGSRIGDTKDTDYVYFVFLFFPEDPVIQAKSLEVMVMALYELKEAKFLSLQVSWSKTRVQPSGVCLITLPLLRPVHGPFS